MQVVRAILTGVDWRISTYSNAAGGDCVEVGHGVPGAVAVRDSTRPAGPVLAFPDAAWAAFVDGVRSRTRS